MARKLRIEYEGATYHVTARGNERRRIFLGDEDRELFLQALQEATQHYRWRVHAYCLMPNHYHLAVETPRANLSRAMAWLQTTFTMRFNQRHRRSGHLFQGRFKAHVVEKEGYAPVLLRYIHLNPLMGQHTPKGMPLPREAWRRLREFRWSSHRAYAGYASAPEWLSLDWHSFFGERRNEAQKEYRTTMRAWFEEGEFDISEQVQGGVVLGSGEFLEKLTKLVHPQRGNEAVRWLKHQRRQHDTEIARKLATTEADQRLKVWLRVRLGGEIGANVAREFGWQDGSAVSQIIKRLADRRHKDATLDRKMRRYEKEVVSRVTG